MNVAVRNNHRRLLMPATLASCVLLVLLIRGVPLLKRWYAAERERAEESLWKLASAREVLRQARQDAGEVVIRQQAADSMRQRVISAATANAAASAAANHFRRVAAQANVEVRSVNVAVDSLRSGMRRVALGVSARGDVKGLVALLGALEQGSRIARVPSLSVSQPDVSAGTAVPESLNLQLTVELLARVPR